MNLIGQMFPKLLWRTPSTSHFVCLLHLTHLIQFISSLVESAKPELGVRGLPGQVGNPCYKILHCDM